MPSRYRTAAAPAALALTLITGMLLVGCTADSWDESHDAPSLLGTLGPGFLPSTSPAPAATITPSPGSWDEAHPSPGYRVVLLTSGDDEATTNLITAVREWAAAEEVELRTLSEDGDHIEQIVAALELSPDLIIGVGNDLVDPLALVTASHLDQEFLVVGAELAEPTENVTAVAWIGASFRGEGNGASSVYDATTFTPERCARAVRAGVTSVLSDLTGIVIAID